jgi:hypothetical protein
VTNQNPWWWWVGSLVFGVAYMVGAVLLLGWVD